MRDIPPCVTQQELNPNKVQIDTRAKSKEAILEEDPKCTNLIEDSMYDTNPVHYIIMVHKS